MCIEENVYLRKKSNNASQDIYHKNDICITSHYGNPTCAIILYSGKHIIIAGCGLTIYDIENKLEKRILCEPDNIWWTNGLHQHPSPAENLNTEFRFISFNKDNKLRVFKLNIETNIIEEQD